MHLLTHYTSSPPHTLHLPSLTHYTSSPPSHITPLLLTHYTYSPPSRTLHRGVNMYAMLVGKLPFRSPRHGTRRRQRLLEQITAGLSESHEKEMAHLSPGATDLLCKLLQPDPRKRITLDVAMQHLWITKDGTHPLHPHKHIPPDAATQTGVSVCFSSGVLGQRGDYTHTHTLTYTAIEYVSHPLKHSIRSPCKSYTIIHAHKATSHAWHPTVWSSEYCTKMSGGEWHCS